MRVKFGDVVRDVKLNVDRTDNPYEFYVAGDHMDSEDFRIHRRGRFATDDVGPAFVRIFRPGQVLYGSRRTYLKKVCVADFEGVTANTTFVLESKDEGVLLQRMLPFLMLGEAFTDWSIKHSKGSTNPYVLFSDLAKFEFDLPPMEEQKNLANLLWAANDLKEKYKKAIAATDEMLKAKFEELMRSSNLTNYRFSDICILGPQNGFYRKGAEKDGVTQTLKMKQLFAYESMEIADDCDRFLMTPDEVAKYKLTPDDLVFGRRSIVPEGAGKCRRVGNVTHDLVFESSMLRVTINTRLALPRFIQTWTECSVGEETISRMRSGTTIVGIKGSDLKVMPISIPPLALQQQFVEIARKADETKAALKKSIADVDQVIKGFVNG